MARVCEDMFPKGFYPGQKDAGFYMDDLLKAQLDVLLKNITRDWDFTIIITGGGEVRVGKSVLAMQIGMYWTYMIKKLYGIELPFNVQDNFVFNGKELIMRGNALGKEFKYAALNFDEAGSDLQSKKVMSGTTQDLLDYFRECGQYNMLNILVLPDYFELPMSIAITRSICLIDVYYSTDTEGYFERGYFNFYSRKNKKLLYLYGKKTRNYTAYRYDFHGRFYPMYPINEQQYRQAKQDALRKREAKETKTHRWEMQRDALMYELINNCNYTQDKVADTFERLLKTKIDRSTVASAIQKFKKISKPLNADGGQL